MTKSESEERKHLLELGPKNILFFALKIILDNIRKQEFTLTFQYVKTKFLKILGSRHAILDHFSVLPRNEADQQELLEALPRAEESKVQWGIRMQKVSLLLESTIWKADWNVWALFVFWCFLPVFGLLALCILAQYHLFFTNVVPHVRLDPLASCDEYELVKQVGPSEVLEVEPIGILSTLIWPARHSLAGLY